MISILVQLNLNTGSVVISSTEDGELCELRLQWRGSENGIEGFHVVENTFSFMPLPKGIFVPISEVASEIFIKECVGVISQALSSTNIEYVTDNGVHLSSPVFLPLSIMNDDEIESFINDQKSLGEIWGEYRQSGELNIQQFDTAHKDDVMYDFVSLLNFERFILVTQLEKS